MGNQFERGANQTASRLADHAARAGLLRQAGTAVLASRASSRVGGGPRPACVPQNFTGLKSQRGDAAMASRRRRVRSPSGPPISGSVSGMASPPPRKRAHPCPGMCRFESCRFRQLPRPAEGQGLLSPTGGFNSLTGHHHALVVQLDRAQVYEACGRTAQWEFESPREHHSWKVGRVRLMAPSLNLGGPQGPGGSNPSPSSKPNGSVAPVARAPAC